MKNSHFSPALQFASDYLSANLPPQLTYHTYQHTFEEVLPAVSRLTMVLGVPSRERELLEVAAGYHDIGFTQAVQGHERIGAALVEKILPDFGFTSEEIQIVQGLILATTLPQQPTTLLEEIMADADLDVLGSDNFFERNEDLRREMEFGGAAFTDQEWLSQQMKFIETHTYFTQAARDDRDPGKQRNLIEIKQRLAEIVRLVP
jgi:uncharacterized protein